MIILDATNRSLEIDLNAAVTTNQLPFVASYVDINQSTFAMSAMSTNTGASNSTTAVTLVAAPGATTSRQLKYLSVKNSDTTSVLLWIQLNDNTTLREIWKGTLAVGDTLVYVDSLGFNVVDSSGGIKSSLVNTMSTLTLTSTLTMSGTVANIALGSNFISNGGTDAGLSLDASNNATFSGILNGTSATAAVRALHDGGSVNASSPYFAWYGGTGAGATTRVGYIGKTDQVSANMSWFNETASGNITIGTNSGDQLLLADTAGSSRIHNGIRVGADSSNNLLDDASNGAGTAALYIGNAQITAVSDVRLKTDVVDTRRDMLEIFNRLRVVDHTWNDPSDQCENNRNSRGVWTGLIAQEAIEHIPWIVNKPLDDSYWFMDYNYMAPMFVRGFQQIDERLKVLEARVLQ